MQLQSMLNFAGCFGICSRLGCLSDYFDGVYGCATAILRFRNLEFNIVLSHVLWVCSPGTSSQKVEYK
jgi:hypothetical protein